jgi:hypothetical protein
MISPEREIYLRKKLLHDRKEAFELRARLMGYYNGFAPGPDRDRVAHQIKELSFTVYHIDKYFKEASKEHRTFFGLLPDE